MTSLQKLRTGHVVKWVSTIFGGNASISSKPNLYVSGSYSVRFCSTETAFNWINDKVLARIARKEVEAALLEYLHGTRSLPFTVAEHMSKNCPKFSEKVLKKVEIEDRDMSRAVRRFLRYYPIDEYELFYESVGLKPPEYTTLLPQSSMFLRDDELLLENYHALWHYGIPRKRIGKFFKETREIFGYDYGVLSKKLKSLEDLGLRQSLVAKILASSPRLLKESAYVEFVEALRKLERAGVGNEWLEQHISKGDSYDWTVILEHMLLLSKTGLSDEQLGRVIMQHGDLLLKESGRGAVLRLFGFLSKLGFTQEEMKSVFIQLPDMPVLKFASNICKCYEFLVQVKMNCDDIGRTIRSNPILLGSCHLKHPTTLKIGVQRACQMILDDPNVLKDWVHATPVRATTRTKDPELLKTKFLQSLGLKENSKEMKRASKLLRGKAYEHQERFDCLVDLGLSRKEVIGMVKLSPTILKSVNKCQNIPILSESVWMRMESGDRDIGKAVRRFFFQHIGLKPSEHESLLLDDLELFLENCYALYNYGIPKIWIRMFFMEAREIFGYDYGVLSKKLESFEKLGLSQSLVAKIIMSSPHLLKERNLVEFGEALRKLHNAGIQNKWLEHHITKVGSCNWKVILELMCLLSKTGLSDEQLGVIIMEHHDILIEQNGRAVIRLFGFLSKFGFTQGDMKDIFVQLPDISAAKFTSNLCQCYEFLVKINMNCEDIGKIVLLHPIVLGSCDLRTVGTLLKKLRCQSNRLCQMILDDPNVIKGWVKKVDIQSPVPRKIQYQNTVMLKAKFLLNLGFKENSKEMEKALKLISGESFQERFDCFVDLGLSREEVIKMVKKSPKILNLSKDVILKKIASFVDLGYSVSDLLNHPPIMCYTIERVKLRILIHQLLKHGRRGDHTERTLSTLLSPSDKEFLRKHVLWHPRGLEYLEKVKKEINA